ncbi:SH3 domain-binding glutamic acid-rich-like protein 3 [Ambystoma mexicanum]|uniref:SH3 domain-binding glutamic acid-rich-like protein 3 n=1 Tax=Ambystoma mexicanum TaxID=8296 RepID=UPI0037E82DF3
MSPNNAADIKVYYTSVSGSREVKKSQSEVTRILDANQIKYELIDISVNEELLEEMRQKAGNPCAVPPQIFNGDDYCGDYQMMYEATENLEFRKFLKLPVVDQHKKNNLLQINFTFGK